MRFLSIRHSAARLQIHLHNCLRSNSPVDKSLKISNTVRYESCSQKGITNDIGSSFRYSQRNRHMYSVLCNSSCACNLVNKPLNMVEPVDESVHQRPVYSRVLQILSIQPILQLHTFGRVQLPLTQDGEQIAKRTNLVKTDGLLQVVRPTLITTSSIPTR